MFSDVSLKFVAYLVLDHLKVTRINTLYILYRQIADNGLLPSERTVLFLVAQRYESVHERTIIEFCR